MNAVAIMKRNDLTFSEKQDAIVGLAISVAKSKIICEELLPILRAKRTQVMLIAMQSIASFKWYYNELGRIPTEWEFYHSLNPNVVSTVRYIIWKRYGGYHRYVYAILGEKVKIKRARFGIQTLASDGHFCGSLEELKLEEFLIGVMIQHVPHKRIKYREKFYVCDQYLPLLDLYIEMDGAPDNKEISSLTDGKKVKAYEALGLNYLILTPADMEPKLKEVLNEHTQINR